MADLMRMLENYSRQTKQQGGWARVVPPMRLQLYTVCFSRHDIRQNQSYADLREPLAALGRLNLGLTVSGNTVLDTVLVLEA